MNSGCRWCNFIPKNDQGLSLHSRRCKWRPKAQAQIPRDTKADAPPHAYFDPQAEPNAGIHQYLASGGGGFEGFSASGYQEECTSDNGNDILRSGDSNRTGLLSILLLLHVKTFKERINKKAGILIISIKD
jgi:hypothetical protein